MSVEGVACFAGFNAAEERKADEGQVADEVKGFVAAKFVRVAEGAVHDAVLGQDDRVVEGAAAYETHSAERFDIGFEAEGAGAGENLAEGVWIDEQFDLLLANERMGEVYVAADAELVGGIDADAAAVFDDFDWFEDASVTAFAAEAANSCLIEELQEWFGGTVEDGNFDVVEVDKDVVDAVGIGSSKEVFGGGEQDALLHEAGGIADAGDVVAVGFNREIVEVNAAEDDASVGRSGLKAEFRVNAGVKTHTLDFYGAIYRGLKHCALKKGSTLSAKISLLCALYSTRYSDANVGISVACGNQATEWWVGVSWAHPPKMGLPAGAGYPSQALARPNRMVY